MRRTICFWASLFITILLAQSVWASSDENKKTIQLINRTKLDIISVHLSPAGKKQWGDNILVTGVFRKGESEVIEFTPENKDICEYDLKTIKVNGDSIVYNNLNLCHLLNVSLYFEDGKAYLKQNLVVENLTGFAISELYVSDSSFENWSFNVLGSIVLSDFDEASISFTPQRKGCLYDIRARRFSGVDVLFRNINLCRTYKITLFWGEGVPYYSLFDFR